MVSPPEFKGMRVVRERDGVITLYGRVAELRDFLPEQKTMNLDNPLVKMEIDTDVIGTQTDPRPCAACIGPVGTPAEAWANRDKNAALAALKRFISNHKPWGMKTQDTKKISAAINCIIKHHFPREKVIACFLDHPVMAELRSPKMTPEVFEKTVDDLLDASGVLPEYKFMVKNEVLLLGKNPRLIINAGNMHQIAALLVISIFEKMWFTEDTKDHIKNSPKREALHRVVDHLNSGQPSRKNGKSGVSVPMIGLEGDGSSWDFCCSPELRRLIERPILRHILDCILDSGAFHEVPYEAFENSLDFASKKVWAMKQSTIDWKEGHKRVMYMSIVRASGERGTSCLNHLINIVLWTCCLLDNPCELFSRMDRGAGSSGWYVLSRRLTGSQDRRFIYFRAAFEGDDSLLRTVRWLYEQYSKNILAYWTDAGHRMKLVSTSTINEHGSNAGLPRGYCVYVGYDILFEDNEFTKIMCPTISRNLASQAFTTSYYACQEGKDRQCRVNEVGMQSHASRAIAYHPHMPYLANFYVALMERCSSELKTRGDELKFATKVDEQMHFKLGLPLGETIDLSRLLEEAELAYDFEEEPLYDELVFRTTGHRNTEEDKTAMTMLTDLGIDDIDEVLAAIPERYWEPYLIGERKLPDEFMRLINNDEIGL